MQLVLLPLTDVDKDGSVTREELYGLQIKASEWAKTKCQQPVPKTLEDLCDVIHMGFDRNALLREYLHQTGAEDDLSTVRDALKVRPRPRGRQTSKQQGVARSAIGWLC